MIGLKCDENQMNSISLIDNEKRISEPVFMTGKLLNMQIQKEIYCRIQQIYHRIQMNMTE